MRRGVAVCLLAVGLGCGAKESAGPDATGNGNGAPEAKSADKQPGATSFSVDNYQGKSPVLVARCAKDHPAYQQFSKDLEQHQQALQKHGVVVVELYGIQNAQVHALIRGQRDLNFKEASDLQDRFGGSTNPKLFLIGKDGSLLLQEEMKLDVAKALQLLEAPQ